MIQSEIRQQLGLLVDVVKVNSGTTNDGNTASSLLGDKNRKKFAQILEIEEWLVDDLHNVLVAISCDLYIDSAKFGNYCKKIAEKYVATYEWLPMAGTIHNILIHGKDIIENSALPIGMLSEQAAESRNKFWRSDRENTRKVDRKKTMQDLFSRALESSDPVLVDIRLKRRQNNLKRIPLPQVVTDMLINTPNLMPGEIEDDEFVDESVPEHNLHEHTLILSLERNIYEEENDADEI